MDRIDRKILELLQRDGTLTASALAERVGLSKAPCWRRVRRMQDAGLIKGTVALLDARKINVGTTVFVSIKTANHSAAWFERFMRTVREVVEVSEIYRMSGDVDYLMRVNVPDIAAYDRVYRQLIADLDLLDVSASFTLETIKHTTALPLGYVTLD